MALIGNNKLPNKPLEPAKGAFSTLLVGKKSSSTVDKAPELTKALETMQWNSKESLIRQVGHETYYQNKRKPSKADNTSQGDRPGATPGEASEKDDHNQLAPTPPADVRPEHPQSGEDYWTMQGDMLIRHHRRPRLSLFVPDDQNLPIPLKYVDVTRQTDTSLESPCEKVIRDYWNVATQNPAGGDPMQENRQLSEPWTGRTIFNLLRQPLPEGWEWVCGRATKIQKTNRPPTIWPEFWKALSTKQKEQAVKEWALEKPKLEQAQTARGFKCVPADDKEYLPIINAARVRLAQEEPPAMLCVPYGCYSAGGDPGSDARGVKYHLWARGDPAQKKILSRGRPRASKPTGERGDLMKITHLALSLCR